MKTKTAFLLIFLLIAIFSCSKPEEEKLNVVLISIDSLRADHVGAYGYFRNTTPHIDRLAEKGILFENAISTTSWTLPAHIALFTSLFDTVHGVIGDHCCLDDKRMTLTEILKKQGYATAGFYNAPYLDPRYGFAAGFDVYARADITDALRQYKDRTGIDDIEKLQKIIETRPNDLPKDLLKKIRQAHQTISGPITTELGLNWIREGSGKPFFLFLHYWDVHYDYMPPPPYDTRFGKKSSLNILDFKTNPNIHKDMSKEDLDYVISQYDGEIAFTDKSIGDLLKGIEQMGLSEKTVICITADHGEAFFEHDFKGHGITLFEEEIRIPLLFSLPNRLPQGVRFKEQVSLVDIAPTLLELIGQPIPSEMMGKSLLSLAGGTESWPERQILAELCHTDGRTDQFALRTNSWKLFHRNKIYRFFDLERDPLEKTMLERFPGGKGHINSMEKTLREFKEIAHDLPKEGTKPGGLTQHLKQQLIVLGYLDEEETEKTPKDKQKNQ